VIPLKDYNPTSRFAWVTVLLIVVCGAVYFGVQPGGKGTFIRSSAQDRAGQDLKFTVEHAAIPCEIVKHRPLADDEIRATFGNGDATACDAEPSSPPDFPHKNVYLAILYSMFLHGSLLHIAGNMLFLWIFGNNIEDRMGPIRYLLFYLAAGLAATATFVALQPNSTVPMIGASGAIAGVMGAYLVLFPNVRIRSLIFLGFIVFFRDLPAKWLLLFWFALQFFTSPSSGVAWTAHVGGFVFGAVVGLIWRMTTKPHLRSAPSY
jgi:membrane associated rhomboid family serine protease